MHTETKDVVSYIHKFCIQHLCIQHLCIHNFICIFVFIAIIVSVQLDEVQSQELDACCSYSCNAIISITRITMIVLRISVGYCKSL